MAPQQLSNTSHYKILLSAANSFTRFQPFRDELFFFWGTSLVFGKVSAKMFGCF